MIVFFPFLFAVLLTARKETELWFFLGLRVAGMMGGWEEDEDEKCGGFKTLLFAESEVPEARAQLQCIVPEGKHASASRLSRAAFYLSTSPMAWP